MTIAQLTLMKALYPPLSLLILYLYSYTLSPPSSHLTSPSTLHTSNTGGHMEKYESWEATAIRELKEETDLDLDPSTITFVGLTNDPMQDIGRHYITIFVAGRLTADSKPLKNMEPHKCEEWIWETWSDLKEKRLEECFGPLKHALVLESFQEFMNKVK